MEIIADQLINLPGYTITKIEGVQEVILSVQQRQENKCVHCKSSQLHIKDSKHRLIRHENFSSRAIYLSLLARKFKCLRCSRYFWERFPGVLPYNRKTEPFRKQVALYALKGVTKKDVAIDCQIGEASVYRYFLKELKIKASEFKSAACPKVLGIDEHFFTKKKGYATTLCDLRNHRVYDVVLGRSEAALASYFRKLKGKENVEIVVMDLSETYRKIIKKHFPNAKIVSDRFHVIRLINQHFMALWREIDASGKYNRGLISLMRRHQQNLSSEQKLKLYKYFEQFPVLKTIYFFKQKICKLLLIKNQTKKQCKKLIPVFLKYLKQLNESAIDRLVTLGNTLNSWEEEVVRMWRFSKSNGITEGFHTKMEMLSRRAYGFRNFENYRLWVKILCR